MSNSTRYRIIFFCLALLVLIVVPTRPVGVADGLPADHPLDLWIVLLLVGGFFHPPLADRARPGPTTATNPARYSLMQNRRRLRHPPPRPGGSLLRKRRLQGRRLSVTPTILVTGGAGFIGSHLVDALVERGKAVRVLDILDSQVHPGGALPSSTQVHVDAGRVGLHVGDVRDRRIWSEALRDVSIVFHHAAAVGIGQSMYEVARYVEVNTQGTALLLDILANEPHGVEKLIVASSMSIYGEGSATCPECGPFVPELRGEKQLQKGDYEIRCPACGAAADPLPTPETKPPVPTSVYAISKRDQEELCLTIGRAYNIPTVALRYFNVYGPRQALTNPYTGVAAIFSSRLLNNNPPLIFEDGAQTRDFIHVSDIVQANLLAMDRAEAAGQVFNIGTGQPTSVAQLAGHIAQALGSDIAPTVVGKYRSGDIRHCIADISRAREVLGFEPRVPLAEGVADLVDWVSQQEAEDRVEHAARELDEKGLTL